MSEITAVQGGQLAAIAALILVIGMIARNETRLYLFLTVCALIGTSFSAPLSGVVVGLVMYGVLSGLRMVLDVVQSV